MSHEAATATGIDWHDCAAVAGSSSCAPLVRTSEVCLVFTSTAATESEAHVARHLARALAVPLTLILFNRTWQGGQPPTIARRDDEVRALVEELRADGNPVTTRVYVCHSVRHAIPFAFHRGRWWLSAANTAGCRRRPSGCGMRWNARTISVVVVDDGSGASAKRPDGSERRAE